MLRFAPLGDVSRAAAIAAELNALPFAAARERFEKIWRDALTARGINIANPRYAQRGHDRLR